MAGVNKVILVGNLGRDPEIRAVESGRKVANFPIATTESYKDRNGERVEQTEWHNIVFWGPVVDVIEKYVKKGNQIYVEGKLRTRSYDDKEGIKRYVTEVMGQNLTLLGGGGMRSNDSDAGGSSNYEKPQQSSSAPVESESVEDDLPF
ncbi:single-stranded DNA-binding protein [Cytophagaceae bacterium ABcell3]|nr:single-stranded DNA-binding protein [Cytophagaceae bacterium ABcell3]